MRSYLLALMLFFAASCWSAEPPLEAKDLPHVPPVEATNALKTFQIKKGFKLELVAAEPLVMDPIAMCFDENGRLFVVEMRDYSEMREVHPHLGRIRMLEDTNADGIFDKATVYADDLPWPTSVFCYDGGIFVAASPDILYFKDTKGNGVADARKVVFTGFGAGKGDKLNVQALVNGFTWGLDNRIQGETAPNGGLIVPASNPQAKPLDLAGRDFYFDPRTLELGTETGGGQYGMCYDNRGRKFVCENAHHIRTYMYDSRYAERNPAYNMPPALLDISVDGPAAEVYRISPEEQWRVVRTKWRIAGQVSGPVEGGGRASGYFTSASGITIYRGNAWPHEYLGDAFICECAGNLVHHKKVRPDGPGVLAERPADEQKVEFLASTDLWFRPVQMANAPDGTLYVADMYREIIEHPWSLPASIKKLLDLNAGNDRGRIYRIVPDGFKQPEPPRLGQATTGELVAMLDHPNGWHRDTAARLLYEHQDKAAVPLLRNLLEKSGSWYGRMHVLYALDGLGALQEADVIASLNDPAPEVRQHAVRFSERFNTSPSDRLWAKLRWLADDPDITVRYQLALTLGQFDPSTINHPSSDTPGDRQGRIQALAAIALHDADNPWTQAAILSSLAHGAGELFAALATGPRARNSQVGQEFLQQLVILVGAKNHKEEVAQVLAFIAEANQPALRYAALRGLGEGLRRASSSLTNWGDTVKAEFAAANKTALDEKAQEKWRVEAIKLLGLTSYAESGILLLSLLDLQRPQAVQSAALATLGRFNDPQVGPELVKHWDPLTPRLRSEALAVLLARADRATVLLEAIAAEKILPSALDSTQIKFLRNHRDKAVRQLALKTLGAKPAGSRQQVIDSLMPALELKGNAKHGKKIYEERCISCHRLGGEGYALGPDLVTVKNTGKEKIMVNILDPNREVRPDFVAFLIETKDDESALGLIANETAGTVTLRQAYGKEEVIQRSNIKRMQSQALSLMPEGVEAGMASQDLADLLEYIETAEGK